MFSPRHCGSGSCISVFIFYLFNFCERYQKCIHSMFYRHHKSPSIFRYASIVFCFSCVFGANILLTDSESYFKSHGFPFRQQKEPFLVIFYYLNLSVSNGRALCLQLRPRQHSLQITFVMQELFCGKIWFAGASACIICVLYTLCDIIWRRLDFGH